ncbi:MAG: hypothetical protein ABI382_11625 [Nakamurella sp.]
MLFLILLLIVGAVLGILGFVVKGLIWLAIIGIVVFVIGLIFGGVRGRTSR